MRSCMAAFTPETRSPSFFRTDFSCVLIRVFTLAITAGVSWNGPCEAISWNFNREQPLLEQNLEAWKVQTQIEVIKSPRGSSPVDIDRQKWLPLGISKTWVENFIWDAMVGWSVYHDRCSLDDVETVLWLEATLWGSSCFKTSRPTQWELTLG